LQDKFAKKSVSSLIPYNPDSIDYMNTKITLGFVSIVAAIGLAVVGGS
jgi:hypothetical protein